MTAKKKSKASTTSNSTRAKRGGSAASDGVPCPDATANIPVIVGPLCQPSVAACLNEVLRMQNENNVVLCGYKLDPPATKVFLFFK